MYREFVMLLWLLLSQGSGRRYFWVGCKWPSRTCWVNKFTCIWCLGSTSINRVCCNVNISNIEIYDDMKQGNVNEADIDGDTVIDKRSFWVCDGRWSYVIYNYKFLSLQYITYIYYRHVEWNPNDQPKLLFYHSLIACKMPLTMINATLQAIDICQHKLHHFDIQNVAHAWQPSPLSNRYQYNSVNDQSSSYLTLIYMTLI